jgi:hypothetical protein
LIFFKKSVDILSHGCIMDIVKDDKQTPHKDKTKKIINKFIRTERRLS